MRQRAFSPNLMDNSLETKLSLSDMTSSPMLAIGPQPIDPTLINPMIPPPAPIDNGIVGPPDSASLFMGPRNSADPLDTYITTPMDPILLDWEEPKVTLPQQTMSLINSVINQMATDLLINSNPYLPSFMQP